VSRGAPQILAELQQRGVTVAVDGDILCLKPRRALDDALLVRVRAAKPAILELLRNRPATCAASCYEIEPGRWIHHPWNGCTTIEPKVAGLPRRAAETCWHCQGEKRCGCIACWNRGPGECVTCKGTGQVWRWVQ
jgi:TubC N-terminal docking domain